MNSKIFKNLIVFCCIFLVLAVFTTNSIGQEENSILDRLQRIEDPELGELVRIALENMPESKELLSLHPSHVRYDELKRYVEKTKPQTVRKVTEAYIEIKLLDSQIEQIEKRISSSNIPETLANELILAKTELEAKLRNKIAELRETMNIIPNHPLGRRPLERLNNWIKLDVIGEQVAVFHCSKPFSEHSYSMKHNFVKLMSQDETRDYVAENVNTLPIRIDISRNPEGIKLSEELNKQIIDFIKEKNLEMQAEVHLDNEVRTTVATSALYLEDIKIGRTYRQISRPGNQYRELLDLIDPNEINSIIREWVIKLPGRLPHTIILSHDEQSKDFALSIEKTIKDIAQKAGIEKLVTVQLELYNPEDAQKLSPG